MRSRIYVAFCLLAAAAAVAAASCSRSRPGHFTHATYLPHDAKIDIVAFVNEIGQILLSATARHPMPDAHCPPSSPWSIDRWILLFLPSLSSFLSMLDQSISQKMSPAGTSRCIDLIRSSISLWMQYQLAVARAQWSATVYQSVSSSQSGTETNQLLLSSYNTVYSPATNHELAIDRTNEQIARETQQPNIIHTFFQNRSRENFRLQLCKEFL